MKTIKLQQMLSERVLTALHHPTTQYFGPCVVQAPGAWTRVGPTWRTADGGWICAGPGVASWNTKEGLAELATATTATPTFHASAAAICPTPNLVFAVMPEPATHLGLDPLIAEADALEAARTTGESQ